MKYPIEATKQRFAFDSLKDLYEIELVQDIVETLIGSGLVAGTQALTTDMSSEDIGKASLIGMGFGFAGRPLGRSVGANIGRHLDTHNPKTGQAVSDNYNQARQFFNFVPGKKDMNNKQYETSTKGKGPAEGAMSYLGRQQGDLILQSAAGFVTPHLFAGSELEELI